MVQSLVLRIGHGGVYIQDQPVIKIDHVLLWYRILIGRQHPSGRDTDLKTLKQDNPFMPLEAHRLVVRPRVRHRVMNGSGIAEELIEYHLIAAHHGDTDELKCLLTTVSRGLGCKTLREL